MAVDDGAPGWSEDDADNCDDLEKRAARYREMLGVDDLDALTDQLLSLRKAQRKEGPRPRRSYDIDGPLPETGLQVVPLDPADELAIAWGRRPKNALASWGLSGRCVKVSSAEPFGFARIRFALPARRLKHLFPGTIVAARWDAYLGRFRLIPASGYSETGEYVYAQITRPGIFTAIGLPRDPRVLLALRLLATLAPWAQAVREGGAPVVQPMFEALMKQPLVREFAEDDALLETFGYRKRDFPVRPDRLGDLDFSGGKLDEMLDRLPELDLLDVLDDPNRMIKPVPDPRLPDEWPLPRRRWESLGPTNVTGRIKALAIHPEDGDIIYAGAAGGGVWKTTNGGRDWFPTMHDERSLAIGGLAIALSNPDVLYAATGEWTGDDDQPETPSGMGAGVYRTSDGARTWHLCSSIDSFLCTSAAIHPENPDWVLVGGNKGLHRSQDGGNTWDIPEGNVHALFEPKGTVTSVAISPNDPCRLFAAVHRVGIFRSDDRGDTWRLFDYRNNGIPTGTAANAPEIALGRDAPNGSDFVAVKMDDRLYTSRDGGRNFKRRADTPDRSSSMISWCNLVAVAPSEGSILLAGGTNLYRSRNEGECWTQVGGYGTEVHQDQQAVVFDPTNPDHVFLANDGGVWESNDQGQSWRIASVGLAASQLYGVGASQAPALRYSISLQDFSAHLYDGDDRWLNLWCGEGGYAKFPPDRSDQFYLDTWWSGLNQIDRMSTGRWNTTLLDHPTASKIGQPLAIGHAETGLLLAISEGGNAILRSVSRGGNSDWSEVKSSADDQFTALAIAPSNDRHVYVGSEAGRIWYSRDEGERWSELNAPPIDVQTIHGICVDHSDPRRILVSLESKGQIHVFRGQIDRTGEIIWCATCRPRLDARTNNLNISSVAPHPTLEDILFTGSGFRVLCSLDGGANWLGLDQTCPHVKVMGIDIRERDKSLFLATHGRGLYRRFI